MEDVKVEVPEVVPEIVNFPAGLKVLVVDDDPLCLKVIDQMLRRCNYTATTCQSSLEALELLRNSKENHFDLVLSDVYMPDMDGFKLLEIIGLEMGLPVIMMSSNGETGVVFRGVTHGAVDFLIKPVRIEELRNLWQHVVRKTMVVPSNDKATSEEDGEESKHRADRKRKESRSSGGKDGLDEGGSNAKKPRVVWSVEMHQQFVNAVNQLGIDKAVPKRILDLMNVDGLTRENVASHLQKYRLYLKRVAGINTATGSRNGKGRSDVSGMSGMPSGSLPMPGMVPPHMAAGMLLAGMTADVGPRPHPFPIMPMPAMALQGMHGGMAQMMQLPPGMPPQMMMPMAPLLPSQLAALGQQQQQQQQVARSESMPSENGIAGPSGGFTAMLNGGAPMESSPFAALQVFGPPQGGGMQGSGMEQLTQQQQAGAAAFIAAVAAANGGDMHGGGGAGPMLSGVGGGDPLHGGASGSGGPIGTGRPMMSAEQPMGGSGLASNGLASNGLASNSLNMQQNDLAQMCSQLDVNGLQAVAAAAAAGAVGGPGGAGGAMPPSSMGGVGPDMKLADQDDFFSFLLKDSNLID